MAAIRFVSIERCAAIYPAINLALKVLKKVTPSIEAKRVAHFKFTSAKIEKRLDSKTDRRDIMTYARFHRTRLS